jgi:hypothetical protein
MNALALAREMEEFLATASRAVVLEDGATLFDFASAKYSVSGDDRALLHLWSDERNAVRRVVDAERRNGALRLSVQRFGKGKPTVLEVVATADCRAPAAQRQARQRYQRPLARVLQREFPEWKVAEIASTADLERSFSPVYTRGLLRRGHSAIAFLGVNAAETQPSVDGALTFALLWLDYLREREAGRAVLERLVVFAPPERWAVLQSRLHSLDQSVAHFELHELHERDETLRLIDIGDQGNVATRLVRCPDERQVRSCFAHAEERVRAAVPECEAVVLSSSELGFRLHGLEFARARIATSSQTFVLGQEIVFGSGAHETLLTPESEPLFNDLMARLRAARCASGEKRDPLWRMQPERWLESRVRADVAALDARLDPDFVYAQVPAFAASDRGMIDLLAATRDGHLAVLELKADEDIHLPLQGLDYWSRVKWQHEREAFQKFGYFVTPEGAPRQLAISAPLLLLVAPALHIHPATDKILRYVSPEVDWTLIAVDERWRDVVKVVFRKRRPAGKAMST